MKRESLRKNGPDSSENVTIDDLPGYENLAARFVSFFNALPDAVVFVDTDRRVVMINPAVERIFGYTLAEVLGENTEQFYADRKEYADLGRERYNPGVNEVLRPYRAKLRRKDGSVFPAETVGTVVRDKYGKVIGYLGIMRDISEKVKKDQELDAAQLHYRVIADYPYDWEYWRKPDGSFQYVSPSCERITGYAPDRFIRQPELLDEIILPKDRGVWENHYRESKRKMMLREIQFRIRRKDGEVRWIEHACQPVVRKNGEHLGFRASNRDITERKKVEFELRQALKEVKDLKEHLEAESSYLKEEIELEHDYKNIIGNSNALQYVLFRVEQIARSDTTVLILGETGTGKELIARAIHNTSSRSSRSLVKVNCAALPSGLIENELFGHEKGAFTGAHVKHIGRFELAHGGTLFLDEIGEMPVELQAKLLRVLQDGELERVGGVRTVKVDVRVIAATNRDLEKDVRLGKFRKDLWYRLNVFPLTVPPLRERPEDIPLLVNHFVNRFSLKQGKKITSVPNSVMDALRKFSWPGNIRELENVIERAVINTAGSRLKLAEGMKQDRQDVSGRFGTMNEMEREYITRVLERTNWKVSGKNSAAEILDLKRSTLRARMKKLGIRRPEAVRHDHVS